MKKWLRDLCLMTVITALLVGVAAPAMALPPRSQRHAGVKIASTTQVALLATIVTWTAKKTGEELFKAYVVTPVVNAAKKYVINPVVNKVHQWLSD